MTSSDDADRDDVPDRVQLSAGQVAVSSLAAVSAAIVCSFFGVAGTVIGTAVTSVVATIGGALYSYSLRRTRVRLRRLHQAGAASPPLREVWKTAKQQGRRLAGQMQWRVVALGTGIVFVFAIGVVSAIEVTEGESLSALFGVSHGGNGKSSLGSAFGFGSHRSTAKPSPKPSRSKSPTPTSSASPTPSRTRSTSPTSSPSPSPTPSGAGCLLPHVLCHPPTPTPSSSPSSSATPTP